MRRGERQALRERYGLCCGYCGVRETEAGAQLTADHFQPRSRGGSDNADNLVYCCHACNEFKGDYWQPEVEQRILHPLRANLSEHIANGEDGTLRPLTETGRFHIERLHLNRAELIAQRLARQVQANHLAEQQALLSEIARLERRIETLQTQIAGDGPDS